MGWNAIRLGVVWAGAQPRDGDALDAEFVRRLHAVLDLCDREGLHVLLDNHGDMVGSAGCGNGVPMWIQRAAAPNLIGAPLRTDLPWSLSPKGRVSGLSGYHVCGDNATKWAAHAGCVPLLSLSSARHWPLSPSPSPRLVAARQRACIIGHRACGRWHTA